MIHTKKVKIRVAQRDGSTTERKITLFVPCNKHKTYICKCKTK